MNNQKGLSIIELLICIVIFGIVISLWHKSYADITKSSNRTQQMTKMQIDARDALVVLVREIRNMGCKFYLTPNGTKFDKHLVSNAFIADSSSFVARQGDPSDTLKIYKAKLSETGEYVRTDSVEFYLDSNNLIRKLNNQKLRFCANVQGLQFQYGVFANDSMLQDLNPIPIPGNWLIASESGATPTATVVGSSVRFDFSGISRGMIYYNTSFANDTNQRLNVALDIVSDKIFDSLQCCIVNSTVNKGVEKFLPVNRVQHLTINTQATSTGKIAIRYWTKSSGQLMLNGVEVRRQDYGKFVWLDSVSVAKKKTVRAIKISMVTRSKSNDIGNAQTTPFEIGNISIARTGKYEWKTRTETIETLNNGIF
ncbi:MAG: prepilin-type N-terminal cleavage/methylation domain-containing protein [Candidatus Nanoarchaeia archaeon]|jgi:type II secretory pathway pseudopilin PulG|nr:prepilin-type N-terminal cleavage/methylation domain-containing protein [Candidatus Nanoarchaeia archaeon]